MRSGRRLLAFAAVFLWMATSAWALEAASDSTALDQLLAQQNTDSSSKRTLILNPTLEESRYHVALGLNYTGAQVRYQFSRRWAAEGNYQFASASSDYGSVHANVLGLRLYRFLPIFQRLDWYLGGEGAYADTGTRDADYRTTGFVAGAFSGVEYHLLPRVAVSVDIGPYVISLKEKLSGLSQTGTDFVVNTAVDVYLF